MSCMVFGMKSVDLWVLFKISPHVLNLITIHEYANGIICITYHVISGVRLGLNLVPSLAV